MQEQVYQIGSIQAALCLEVALREHRLHKMNHDTIGVPQARGHSRRCLQPHNARLRANQRAKRHKRRYPSLKTSERTSEDSPNCLNRASESGSTGRGRARQWHAIEARRDRREHRLTMLVLAITRHAFQGLSRLAQSAILVVVVWYFDECCHCLFLRSW